MTKFPPVPAEVKPIAHLLKIAEEHESRNIVVAYWARMGACRLALMLAPGQKTPETAELLNLLIQWLEQTKKENAGNEGITNETTAEALIEEYALRMFEHADKLDKDGVFNKNTVKTFYTAGLLFDVLDQFERMDDDMKEKRKYAKWKAAYIHNCLKNGEIPVPGPRESLEDDLGAVVHSSMVDPEDLKNYTRYEGSIVPGSSTIPDVNVPFQPPSNIFDNPQPSATSPITPIAPTNPTPFNTPVPSQTPSVTPPSQPVLPSVVNNTSGFVPDPEEVQKAQKYCKYAASALNYDDIKNAVDYLSKALLLLQTGKEEPGN